MTSKQDEIRQGLNPEGRWNEKTLPFQSEGKNYEIHVKGQLNSQWSEWLEGLEVKLLEDGEMILSGPIVDQAALMGILYKLNRLNLTLLSISEVKPSNKH